MNIDPRTKQYICAYANCKRKFATQQQTACHLSTHFGGVHQQPDDYTTQSIVEEPDQPIKSEPSNSGYQNNISYSGESIKIEPEEPGQSNRRIKRKRKQSRPQHIVNAESEPHTSESKSKRKSTPPSNSETSRQRRLIIKLKVPSNPLNNDEDYVPDEDPDEDYAPNEHRTKKKRSCGNYVCDVCNKKFNIVALLTKHKKVHTKLNHECRYCAESFCDRDTKRKHERHVHKDVLMRYKCTYCPKAFQYPNFLDSHIRTHTGEKPFECDVCEKRFTERGTMVAHRRVHFDETPYHCDLCDRQFKHNSSLRAHKNAHYKERPFKCDLCKHYYRTKKTLRHHRMLMHPEQYEQDEKFKAELRRIKRVGGPPVCPECNNTFASKRTIRVHTMRIHKFNYDQYMRNKAQGSLAPIINLGKQFGVDFSHHSSAQADAEQSNGLELVLPESMESNHPEPSEITTASIRQPTLAIVANPNSTATKRASKRARKIPLKLKGTEDFEQKNKYAKMKNDDKKDNKNCNAKSKKSTTARMEKSNANGDTKTGKAKSKKSITLKLKVGNANVKKDTTIGKAKSKNSTTEKKKKSNANEDTKTGKTNSKKSTTAKMGKGNVKKPANTGKAKSKKPATKKRAYVKRNQGVKQESTVDLQPIFPREDSSDLQEILPKHDLSQESLSDSQSNPDDVVLFDEAQIQVINEEVIPARQPTLHDLGNRTITHY